MSTLELLLSQAGRLFERAVDLDLGRMRRLLAALGDPQRGLPVIHVAGTNGKGSTVALIAALLRQAGYTVGCYTSPHLHRFNERIAVDGVPIADAELLPLLARVLELNRGEPVTFFEFTTAVALSCFARRKLDWVVLETGLGGRLDATNLAEPLLTVITSIGLDHREFLGETIAAVAVEKAGILKPGVGVVAHPVVEEAVAVVVERAAAVGCELWLAGREFTWRRGDGAVGAGWGYRDGWGTLELPAPGLLGAHQYDNAALAVAAVRFLMARRGAVIPEAAWGAGVSRVRWPGRLERCGGGVWLDGAHNPAAAAVLAASLTELGLAPVGLIFSALRDKDLAGMARELSAVVARVWVVGSRELAGERGMSAAELLPMWQGVPAVAVDSLVEALELARASGLPVVVAGSLYLVAAARELVVEGSRGVASLEFS